MFKIKKNRIRIRKNDKFRALLTDTLPYEVPLLFSNEGLYLAAKKGLTEQIDNDYNLNIFTEQLTIPYKYRIKKNSYEFRGLSVMHPAQQLSIGRFYSKYEHLIVGLCQRSPFALRAPGAIASYFVERMRASRKNTFIGNNVEQFAGGFETSSPVASSYFSYKKYAFMHQFYDSTEFLDLEKKFKFLSKLDISDCFNRIYTHTIAWAVKSKTHAKQNKSYGIQSFEIAFDNLMQNSNHGETAGILVGAEASRIFAEIILQRIDLDILKRASELDLRDGVQYAVKRYVDDYFVYCNSEAVLNDLKRVISDCLAEYKLAVNPGKTLDYSRPFTTAPTISKHKIAEDITAFFDRHREAIVVTDADGKFVSKNIKIKSTSRKTKTLANQTIASIKRSIGESGSYDSSANYFFGTIKKLVSRLMGKNLVSENGDVGENLYYFLSALVEIIFFYYSMTPRVRQTYVLSEIIIMLSRLMNEASEDLKDSLIRKIVHESRLVIMQESLNRETYKIEVMNLLIVIREFGEKYVLDELSIMQLFNIKEDPDKGLVFGGNFDYFQMMFLTAYLGGLAKYVKILRAATAFCIDRFNDDRWTQNAECTFLFFDLITCPHVTDDEKLTLAKSALAHNSIKNLNARSRSLVSTIGGAPWFFNWDAQGNLALVLKKKELRNPY